MKQTLYRMLFWLVIMLSVLFWLPVNNDSWQTDETSDNPLLEHTVSSQVYPLDRTRALTFNVNPAQFPVRVMTNASLDDQIFKQQLQHVQRVQLSVPGENLSDALHWRYAVQLELIDDDDNLLFQQEYHFRSGQKLRTYHHDGQVLTGPLNLYASGDLQVLDTRIMLLNPPDNIKARAAQLKIRLKQADAPLSEVVVRSYEQLTLSEKQVTHRWQRLSQKQKDQLVADNIYNRHFVTAAEKQQLLSSKRQPMGPIGVLGEDYQQKKLYVGADSEAQPSLNGSGKAADLSVGQVKAFFIHQPQTKLFWQVQHWLDATRTDSVGITVQRYSRAQEPEHQVLRVTPGEVQTQHFETGLVLFSSSQPLQFSIGEGLSDLPGLQTAAINAAKVPATDPAFSAAESHLKTYALGFRTGPVFNLPRQDGQSAPLRIDLWQRLDQPYQSGVEMQVFDRRGQQIDSLILPLSNGLNLYDQLSSKPGSALSERSRLFYHLPAEGYSVRFSGPESVMLNLSTRPYALPVVRYLPEDYRLSQAINDIPDWFRLRPVNEHQLEQQAHFLTLQRQPPEPAHEPSHWQSLLPAGNSLGRYLLSPRRPDQLLDPGNLAANFNQLMLNRKQTLLFAHQYRRRFSPTLVLIRDPDTLRRSAKQGLTRLFIDDKLVTELTPLAAIESLRLPEMAAGRYQVRLESDDPDLHGFLSHIQVQDRSQTFYLKRWVSALPENAALAFELDKTVQSEAAEISLLLQVFSRADAFQQDASRGSIAAKGLPLEIQLQPVRADDESLRAFEQRRFRFKRGGGVFSQQWSFRQMQFYSEAQPDNLSYDLAEQSADLKAGFPAYLHLGEDLPPGRYRIQISAKTSHPIYIQLLQKQTGVRTDERHYATEAEN